MTAMLDAGSVEGLTRSVMLGTARHPAPVQKVFGGLVEPNDPKAALKALALLGQHGRFRRPAEALYVSSGQLAGGEPRTREDRGERIEHMVLGFFDDLRRQGPVGCTRDIVRELAGERGNCAIGLNTHVTSRMGSYRHSAWVEDG